ncbi:hypothetical protein K456DRAFT_1834374, partial [Colletotrichum gloeosporioides 23]
DSRSRRALARLDCSSYKEHKDRNPAAFPGTCIWVTQSLEFDRWTSASTVQLLWISADPGCGKSVLARYLVDKVLSLLSTTSPSTSPRYPKIIYFFFKDDSVDQTSVEEALLCLIHQLLSEDSFLFTATILRMLEELGHKRSKSFRDLWSIFAEIVTQEGAGDVICVLDALDECDDRLGDLLDALWHLNDSRSYSFNLKFLFTSRPYDSISRRFQRFRNSGSFRLQSLRGELEAEANKITYEIDGAIDHKVEELGLSIEATEILRKGLRRNPNRTYLWVSVICKMIENHNDVSPSSILDLIENLPGTVEMAYEKILRQCPDVDKTTAALHIILAAARPLSLDEMAAAFAKRDEKSLSGPQLDAEPAESFRNTIRNVCGLFVVVVNSRVYLLHQTARQLLVPLNQDDTSQVSSNDIDAQWKHRFVSSDSNRMLATICLRYLRLLMDWDPFHYEHHLHDEDPSKNQLYCAEHWVQHISNSHPGKFDEEIRRLMLDLCDMDRDGCLSWYRTWEDGRDFLPAEDLSLLNLASYLGIEPAIETLLEKGNIDINERRAMNGHLKVAKLLVERKNVDVDPKDKNGVTPLLLAVSNNHCLVVELILENAKPVIKSHHRWKTHIGKVFPRTKTVDLSVTDAEGLTPRLRALENDRFSWSMEPSSIITTLNRAISSMPDRGRERNELERMIRPNLDFEIDRINGLRLVSGWQ